MKFFSDIPSPSTFVGLRIGAISSYTIFLRSPGYNVIQTLMLRVLPSCIQSHFIVWSFNLMNWKVNGSHANFKYYF